MRIEYKKPWTLNPDPISYQINSGNILTFNNSKRFFFFIDFSLPYVDRSSGKVDTYSNIVWKGNDELGIQLVEDEIVFTFRVNQDSSEENLGVINKSITLEKDKNYTILVTGNEAVTDIYVNNKKEFIIPHALMFTENSTYNFGGGHGDNIEYDINFLTLGTSYLESENISIVDPTLPNVLGYYAFEKNTLEKSWDDSCHFNLINRFYL